MSVSGRFDLLCCRVGERERHCFHLFRFFFFFVVAVKTNYGAHVAIVSTHCVCLCASACDLHTYDTEITHRRQCFCLDFVRSSVHSFVRPFSRLFARTDTYVYLNLDDIIVLKRDDMSVPFVVHYFLHFICVSCNLLIRFPHPLSRLSLDSDRFRSIFDWHRDNETLGFNVQWQFLFCTIGNDFKHSCE